MSQLCVSDDYSLLPDSKDRESHIGRKSLGQQRRKHIGHGHRKTHLTTAILSLSLSLSLSLPFSLCVSLGSIACATHILPVFSSSFFFSIPPPPQENDVLLEFKRCLPLAVGKRQMLAEATRKKAVHWPQGCLRCHLHSRILCPWPKLPRWPHIVVNLPPSPEILPLYKTHSGRVIKPPQIFDPPDFA